MSPRAMHPDADVPEGVLRFNLEIAIEMRELREWSAPELRALFDGIARAQEAVAIARGRIARERGR